MPDVKPWGAQATDDIFNILALAHGAGTLADILKVKPVSRDTIALGVSTAQDEAGDIVAKTVYGAPGTMFDASVEYELVSGTLDLSELFIGQTATAGTVITGWDIKTSNGGWPTLTATGVVGKTLETTVTGYQNKVLLPAITIYGLKIAQNFGGGGSGELGFDAPATCKITGSGLNFTATLTETTDGLGVPVAFSLSGFDGSMSGDLVAYDDIASYLTAITVDTDTGYLWTVTKQPSTSKPVNEYWTGSFEATIADPATALPRIAVP